MPLKTSLWYFFFLLILCHLFTIILQDGGQKEEENGFYGGSPFEKSFDTAVELDAAEEAKDHSGFLE